jgi:monoamine oxidase
MGGEQIDGAFRHQVVVVGAGLAGLRAAKRLDGAGVDVVVLEARDRVGGRLLSQQLADGYTIDLGGQWIGPTQERIGALADELGVASFAQFDTGKKHMSIGGKTSTYSGEIPSLPIWSLVNLQWTISKLERLAKKVPLARPFDAADAHEWDSMTVHSWMRQNVHSATARVALSVAVRAIFAVEPNEMSFLHFLFYVHSGGGFMRLASIRDGAQQQRLVGGAQQIPEALAGQLGERVRLEQPVVAIDQRDGGVVVHTEGCRYEAERVVVAIAPALAARIDYRPALPARRDQLTQRMPMGSVIKCIAAYERPFWREAGFSGELLSDSGVIQLGFDDSSQDGSHAALVGFILGERARFWTARPKDERRRAVLGAFADFFGDKAREPVEYVDKDWLAEPYSRGCYVGVMPPGVQTTVGDALREPIGRIHWAGTETAVEWNGYMDGALESGARAADEVLERV